MRARRSALLAFKIHMDLLWSCDAERVVAGLLWDLVGRSRAQRTASVVLDQLFVLVVVEKLVAAFAPLALAFV